jgi:cysteine desulfurase / selenocysteine lyase
MPVDVQALGCDFYVLRPQAVRPDRHRRALRPRALLEAMPPYQGGGDMIAR